MAEVVGGIVGKIRSAFVDGLDLALAILGAALSAKVVELFKKYLPGSCGLGDETLAAAIGFALFYFGDRIHKRVVPFGVGLFIAGAGAWAKSYVEGLFSKITG
jgi:hypothetical protein